jgi:glycosyltransferase involved in cell wall biosynthesis
MPDVAVIIPNFNHAGFLRQRIDSVLGQSFADIEVVLLDNCSTDHSREIMESYRDDPRITHIEYNPVNNHSPFKQWKRGMELTRADIIWIAESDDFADKDFLAVLLPVIRRDERLGIVYCQSWNVDARGQITGNWKEHTDDLNREKFESDFTMPGPEYIRNFLVHRNTIPNASAVIFRRKYCEMAGGVETSINICGDWITWMKILMVSDVFFCAKSLNYFRRHENSNIARFVRGFDHSRYVERYDRTMRRRFQEYLEATHIDQDHILRANYNYILQEDTDEQLFESNTRGQDAGAI